MPVLQFKTEKEWAEARRKYVTSTEVSALFGQNPRLTAFELYHQKKDPTLDTFEGNERTEMGQALQSAIARYAAHKHAVITQALDLQLAALPEFGVAASGDYMVVGDDPHWPREDLRLAAWFHDHGNGVLEIKNVDSLIYKNEWTDVDMPDHIEIQLQTEMLCWGTVWGAVAVLVGGNRLELYPRARDEAVCRLIERKCAAFMSDFYDEKPPVAIMPQDANMVIALHQYAEPNKVYDANGDDYVALLVSEYKAARAEAAKYEEESKSLKATLFSRIGDAERIINLKGYNVSAAVRAPVEVAAHTRAGFRDLRVTVKKKDGRKNEV